jgi:hypothetical protein
MPVLPSFLSLLLQEEKDLKLGQTRPRVLSTDSSRTWEDGGVLWKTHLTSDRDCRVTLAPSLWVTVSFFFPFVLIQSRSAVSGS